LELLLPPTGPRPTVQILWGKCFQNAVDAEETMHATLLQQAQKMEHELLLTTVHPPGSPNWQVRPKGVGPKDPTEDSSSAHVPCWLMHWTLRPTGPECHQVSSSWGHTSERGSQASGRWSFLIQQIKRLGVIYNQGGTARSL
jgi:hypothetical protein